jgi:hypothetical protein
MKLFWAAFNVLLIGLSMLTGYYEMEPQQLSQANPDAVFCTVVLLSMTFFPIATVGYSIHGAKQSSLRRPSWRGGQSTGGTIPFSLFSPRLGSLAR